MDFSLLIEDKLSRIVQEHNLQIVARSRNYLKLSSELVTIVFSYDERENSCSLFAGARENSLYPIDDYILKNAFDSHLTINQSTKEVFAEQIATFFEQKGKPLISGSTQALKALEKYVRKESEEYTAQLINQQQLDAASMAWDNGDYDEFVKYINKIDRQKLPSSLKRKYKIAIQKLSK